MATRTVHTGEFPDTDPDRKCRPFEKPDGNCVDSVGSLAVLMNTLQWFVTTLFGSRAKRMRMRTLLMAILAFGASPCCAEPPRAQTSDGGSKTGAETLRVARLKKTLTPAQLAVGEPTVNSVGMALIPIPAGRFQMGSPESQVALSDEKPKHRVKLTKSFYLGITEVTHEQYNEVMWRTPSRTLEGQRLVRKRQDFSHHPVVNVSWDDARNFCRHLSAQAKEKAAGNVYRLPTEAEWEYACRAGTTTTYSCGDDRSHLAEYAWFSDKTLSTRAGLESPQAVGKKKPNAWCLYDMLGNVSEWCHDGYGEYSKATLIDPTGASTELYRIYRGGSYISGAIQCRSAYRVEESPSKRTRSLGFRVVCSSDGQNVPRNPASSSTPKPSGLSLIRHSSEFFQFLDRDKNGQIERRELIRSRQVSEMFGKAGVDLTKPMSRGKFVTTYIKISVASEQAFAERMASLKRKLTPAQLAVGDPIVNSIGMVLVPIPAGEFLMGNEDSKNAMRNEVPQHQVTLTNAISLGETEVTQGQWQAVMGTAPWKGKKYVKQGDDYPAAYVSWNDAVEFCNKLSAMPAEKKVGYVYRLPTEAEWEYACRAGTTTEYHFGDDPARSGDYAWCAENSWHVGEKYAHRVRQKSPNVWGLYDMLGNLREYCQDGYAGYSSEPVTDPGSDTSGDRAARHHSTVQRGGSFAGEVSCLRSVFRWGHSRPDERDGISGFRVARTHRGSRVHPVDVDRVKKALTPAQLAVGDPIVDSTGMVLVPIPAGEFRMGSRDSAAELAKRFGIKESHFSDEHPSHPVRLTKPFYLGVTEVTQGQWKAVMGTTPWKGQEQGREAVDCPAMYLSWRDAVEFCHKLGEKEGAVYRLPTEAEWEYACRAGTTKLFSYGDDVTQLGQYAWFNEPWAPRLVGQKIANPWGLYDMHGNVWEWCQDRPRQYSNDPVTDPMGVKSGAYRALRGGSFGGRASTLRSANRSSYPADDRNIGFAGFRVLRSER